MNLDNFKITLRNCGQIACVKVEKNVSLNRQKSGETRHL